MGIAKDCEQSGGCEQSLARQLREEGSYSRELQVFTTLFYAQFLQLPA